MSHFVQIIPGPEMAGKPLPPPANEEILNQHRLYKQIENDSDMDDGREEECLAYVLSTLSKNAAVAESKPQLSLPEQVLSAMDEYAYTTNFLMTIGAHKRDLITNYIKSLLEAEKNGKGVAPKFTTVVELGTYVGYTAVFLGHLIRDVIHSSDSSKELKVYSMEMDHRWASIATQLVEAAGLQDVVTILVGEAAASLHSLVENGTLEKGKGQVDLCLIDHWEAYYVQDLKVLTEELGLVGVGGLVSADNIIFPGAHEYTKYLKEHEQPQEASQEDKDAGKANWVYTYQNLEIESMMPNGWKDSLMISTVTVKQ